MIKLLRHLACLVAMIGGGALVGCDTHMDDGPAPEVSLDLVGGEWVASDAYTPGSAGYSLRQIREATARQDFGQVVDLAKKHAKTFGGDPTCEEAFFLAARAQIAQGNYYKAYDLFEKQLNQYPGGELFQAGLDGEYECAQAFMTGKRKLFGGPIHIKADEEAIMILNKIAAHAPGTDLAEKALFEASEFHYNEGNYREAAQAYDYFLQSFSRSPNAAHAMMRSADATYKLYGGVDYDETPLLDARQKYESFAEQFPRQAEVVDVEAILDTIHSQEAERVYESANFYDRTHKDQAAIYYYQRVIQEYPDTYWAGISELALQARGIEPDRHPAAEPRQRTRTLPAAWEPIENQPEYEEPREPMTPREPAREPTRRTVEPVATPRETPQRERSPIGPVGVQAQEGPR